MYIADILDVIEYEKEGMFASISYLNAFPEGLTMVDFYSTLSLRRETTFWGIHVLVCQYFDPHIRVEFREKTIDLYGKFRKKTRTFGESFSEKEETEWQIFLMQYAIFLDEYWAEQIEFWTKSYGVYL